MGKQELLILSFFDKSVPKKLDNNNLTPEMIEAGIGSNEGSNFPYYELVHKLRNEGLLVLYKDPSKPIKGISRAVGQELLVLSDNALKILQREEIKRDHEAFVTELQFDKLKKEHDLLTKKLTDYTKTKRQAFWAFIISIASALTIILKSILKK